MHNEAENAGRRSAAGSAASVQASPTNPYDKPDPFTPPPGTLDPFAHGIGPDPRPSVTAVFGGGLGGGLPMTEPARERIGDGFARVINRRSDEILSHTPDFISGDFLESAFQAMNHAINRREDWYREQRLMEQKREHAQHAGQIKALVQYLEQVMTRVYRLALVAGPRHAAKTVDQDYQITRLLYDLLEWVESSVPPHSLADVKRRVAENMSLPTALQRMADSIDGLIRGAGNNIDLSACATLLRRAAATVSAANVHAINECEASHNAKANPNRTTDGSGGTGVGNVLSSQR
jgi:hypothetical protein